MSASFAIAIAWLLAGQTSTIGADREALARSLYENATAAYEDGRYQDAIAVFEEAHRIAPRPPVVFSLGQAYRLQFFVDHDLEKLKRAIHFYELYLQQVPLGPRRAQAVQHLAAIRPIIELESAQRSSAIVPEAKSSEAKTGVIVTSATRHAKAEIEGQDPAEVPAVFLVEPGKHSVKVAADGYVGRSLEVVALQGATVTVPVDLEPKPAWISVRAPNGADVYVDGRLRGSAPLGEAIQVQSGPHLLAVSASGRVPFLRELRLERGETNQVEAELGMSGQRLLAFGSWGTAGALAIGAAAFGVSALGPRSDARMFEARMQDPMRLGSLTLQDVARHDELADRYNRRVLGMDVLGGAALVLAAAGFALYFIEAAPPGTQ